MYKTFARFHTLYRGIGGRGSEFLAKLLAGSRLHLLFERYTEGAGDTMILEGFFSGLEAQGEITDLLDILYGSYGERLIATYKLAS